MVQSIETVVRTDLQGLLRGDLALPDALFLAQNIIYGMKSHLSRFNFFDEKAFDKNTPEIFRRAYFVPSYYQLFADMPKLLGMKYGMLAGIAAITRETSTGRQFNSAGKQKILDGYRNASWALLEIIEDNYKVILDPFVSKQPSPTKPSGVMLD